MWVVFVDGVRSACAAGNVDLAVDHSCSKLLSSMLHTRSGSYTVIPRIVGEHGCPTSDDVNKRTDGDKTRVGEIVEGERVRVKGGFGFGKSSPWGVEESEEVRRDEERRRGEREGKESERESVVKTAVVVEGGRVEEVGPAATNERDRDWMGREARENFQEKIIGERRDCGGGVE